MKDEGPDSAVVCSVVSSTKPLKCLKCISEEQIVCSAQFKKKTCMFSQISTFLMIEILFSVL